MTSGNPHNLEHIISYITEFKQKELVNVTPSYDKFYCSL